MALLDDIVDGVRDRMGLGQTWPPPSVQERWDKVETYRRFAENDRATMLQHTPEFHKARDLYTPVAIAQEVCRYSADMLFSAEPIITFEKDENLLTEIIEDNKLYADLVQMAESVAAEGRGALRVIRDDPVADVPLITYVHEDQVIWDIRHGRFVVGGVVVIEVAKGSGVKDVYRLLEEHSKGEITRRLFKGRSHQLGSEVSLDAIDEFTEFLEHEDTGLDVPTLVKWDNVSGGKSDIFGQEAVLEAINADVSYGREKSNKSRPVTFVDGSLVDSSGKANLTGIQILRRGKMQRPMGEEPKQLFETIQPDFQSGEQIAWLDWLIDTALLTMGYSKASYGRDDGGSADSGKALKLRQARTLLKKSGKDRMAKEALISALSVAMAWEDNAASVVDYRPEIELGDGMPRDNIEEAQEAQAWDSIGAISLEEKIRMRRPDYDEEAVQEEIERIGSSAVQGPEPPPEDALERSRNLVRQALNDGATT